MGKDRSARQAYWQIGVVCPPDTSVPRGTSWPEEVSLKEILFQKGGSDNLILGSSQALSVNDEITTLLNPIIEK